MEGEHPGKVKMNIMHPSDVIRLFSDLLTRQKE